MISSSAWLLPTTSIFLTTERIFFFSSRLFQIFRYLKLLRRDHDETDILIPWKGFDQRVHGAPELQVPQNPMVRFLSLPFSSLWSEGRWVSGSDGCVLRPLHWWSMSTSGSDIRSSSRMAHSDDICVAGHSPRCVGDIFLLLLLRKN